MSIYNRSLGEYRDLEDEEYNLFAPLIEAEQTPGSTLDISLAIGLISTAEAALVNNLNDFRGQGHTVLQILKTFKEHSQPSDLESIKSSTKEAVGAFVQLENMYSDVFRALKNSQNDFSRQRQDAVELLREYIQKFEGQLSGFAYMTSLKRQDLASQQHVLSQIIDSIYNAVDSASTGLQRTLAKLLSDVDSLKAGHLSVDDITEITKKGVAALLDTALDDI